MGREASVKERGHKETTIHISLLAITLLCGGDDDEDDDDVTWRKKECHCAIVPLGAA